MSEAVTGSRSRGLTLSILALLMSVVTVLGSLYLSGGMKLDACPLCFYQRTFAMAVAGILLIGLLCGVDGPLLSLLALPSAIGGLGVAIFHVYLVQTGKLECPKGLFDLGPAPMQSLAAYALLMAPLAGSALQTRSIAFLAALLLGGAFVWASISYNPPPRKATQPSTEPLKTCQVPYQEESGVNSKE